MWMQKWLATPFLLIWGMRFAPLTTMCACGQYAAASEVAINRVQAEISASGFDDKSDNGACTRTEICNAVRDQLSVQTSDQRLTEL